MILEMSTNGKLQLLSKPASTSLWCVNTATRFDFQYTHLLWAHDGPQYLKILWNIPARLVEHIVIPRFGSFKGNLHVEQLKLFSKSFARSLPRSCTWTKTLSIWLKDTMGHRFIYPSIKRDVFPEIIGMSGIISKNQCWCSCRRFQLMTVKMVEAAQNRADVRGSWPRDFNAAVSGTDYERNYPNKFMKRWWYCCIRSYRIAYHLCDKGLSKLTAKVVHTVICLRRWTVLGGKTH